MIGNFGSTSEILSPVNPIVITPDNEEQKETYPQVEKEEDINIKPDHGMWLKAIYIKEPSHTLIIMDTFYTLTQKFSHTEYYYGDTLTTLNRSGISRN